jgi:hypothetical protein
MGSRMLIQVAIGDNAGLEQEFFLTSSRIEICLLPSSIISNILLLTRLIQLIGLI